MKEDKNDVRNIKIGFKVSQHEKEEIETYLENNDITLTNLLRELVFKEIRKYEGE